MSDLTNCGICGVKSSYPHQHYLMICDVCDSVYHFCNGCRPLWHTMFTPEKDEKDQFNSLSQFLCNSCVRDKQLDICLT